MKRKLFLLFLIICCLALTVGLLVACNFGSFEQNGQLGGDDGGKDETLFFTVTFDTQGGSKIADIKVESGHLVGEFTLPTKQCSQFVGFALDAGGERIWNVLTDKVSADITLYAIWEDAHDWGDWIIITPATCTKNGEKMRTCNACGETEKEIVPAAHTWGEIVTITAPTCTEEGTQKRLCEVCGKEETDSIPALGHDWEEEYTVEIVPGCETKGSESRHCTRCDATTDSREIAALGHDYDGAGWHYNGANHWKYCTRCGKESERELHSYDSDGVCECGMIEVAPVNEFRFISLGNNTWRLANYTGSRTNVSIPSTYIIPDTVTSIGARSFSGCVNLTSITISKNLATIGVDAFEGCTKIADASIPAIATQSIYKAALVTLRITAGDVEERAFENCGSLNSVVIESGVNSIGAYCFSGCSSISEIELPDTITTIGSGAFYNCTSLTSVTIGNGVTSIGSGAFWGCTSIDDVYYTSDIASWLNIGFGNSSANPLYNGANLYLNGELASDIVIPGSVTSIGESAFSGCTSLTSVTIGDGVTSIGSFAFYYCTSLTSVTIGDGVTSIGDRAFNGCTSLTSVTIPDSVTSIGYGAFEDCYSLTIYCEAASKPSGWDNNLNSSGCPVVWDANNTDVADDGNIYYIDENGLRYALKDTTATVVRQAENLSGNIEIPASVSYKNNVYSVTSIGRYAFRGCTSLTYVTIPDSVTSIGDYAFYDCTGLTEINWNAVSVNDFTSSSNVFYNAGKEENGITVTFGDSVQKIPACAFYVNNSSYYPNIKIVIIGNSVTSIGNWAFRNCTSLTSVTIGDGVTSIGYRAFFGCTSLTSVTIGNGVTSIGEKAFSGCTSLDDVYYTSDIASWLNIDFSDGNANPLNNGANLYLNGELATDIIIPDGVTSIGGWAFIGCTSLTSVTIPDSVTSIGTSAFCGCTSLSSVTIGNSVTSIGGWAFYYCTSLTSVTIPDSVTSIGDQAFSMCDSLTSVIIGDSVTSIGIYAFYECYSLTSVTIPDSVTSIGEKAFYDCTSLKSVTIGNSVTSIGGSAFYGCTGLTEINWNAVSVNDFTSSSDVFYNAGKEENGITVTFGDSVQKIPAYAFHVVSSSYYPNIKLVIIGNSVTSIGDSAFEDCTELTEINWNAVSVKDFTSSSKVFYNAGKEENGITVTFGDSVQKIPAYAFCNCDSLTSVIIPDSVTSIGSRAFSGCSSLTSVTIGDGVTSIGDYAFRNCTSLTSVTIPNSVTSIGEYAFCNCTSLKSVTIGHGVTSIGSYAFTGCTVEINWANNNPTIKTIGSYAFSGYRGTSITIPDSVTSIGEYAFSDCTSLTSITIPDSVTSIGEYAFQACDSLTIYCEDSSKPGGWDYYYWNDSNCPVVWDANNSDVADDGNIYYIDENGLRYALKYTTARVVRQPRNLSGNIEIPASVSYKGITYSVTSIGYGAFDGCTSLTSVTIPDSVTSISSRAFYGCGSLKSVTFEGTVAQWNAISKGSGWNDYTPLFTKVVCSDGTVGGY